MLKTGDWNTYDIIFRAPRLDAKGKMTTPARLTVFHNGVLIQDAQELWGPTEWKKIGTYAPDQAEGIIRLQDHGDPVRFRNIWVRRLPEQVALMH